MKVQLVSMPFGSLGRPALGISLLKSRLREIGIGCDIRYLNFAFADVIGLDDYLWVSQDLPHTAFAGEWVFTHTVYGERPQLDWTYVRDVLQGTWSLQRSHIARLLQIRSYANAFVDDCAQSIRWDDYALVGFTCTFEQNIASLALAKRIKRAFPHVYTVFGGANWEGEMGEELHRRFDFVDFVCSGEADESFPALAQAISAKTLAARSVHQISGIVYRAANGSSVATGTPPLYCNMDGQAISDFSDYFDALAHSSAATDIVPVLLMETSRGCWWGQRSQCTFCGLNGSAITFRSKSPRRALAELLYLTKRWNIDCVEVVDNILDLRYFGSFLLDLSRARRKVSLYYETKANLNKEQVRILKAAGVFGIQPGIESLSDHVLRLMRKGTTALRNIQLLKYCKQIGIQVDWNILYGVPGETRDDYDRVLKLLPTIRHLQPPSACGPIRVDRFSPQFNEPEKFGLVNLRPLPSIACIYPFPEQSVRRIAYYFEAGYCRHLDPRGAADDVVAYVGEWQARPEQGILRMVVAPNGELILLDTRSTAVSPVHRLSGRQRAAYEFCEEIRSARAVHRHLQQRDGDEGVDEPEVTRWLDTFVARRLMVSDGAHYLSVALANNGLPDQPVVTSAMS